MFTVKILTLEETERTLSVSSLVHFDPFACLVSIVFTAKSRRRPVQSLIANEPAERRREAGEAAAL